MSPNDCTVSQPFTFYNGRIPVTVQSRNLSLSVTVAFQHGFCAAAVGWERFLFTAQPYFECPSRVNVLEYNSFYTSLKTLDTGTRLLDNAAFVRIHLVERFSKDFWGVRGLRSRGFSFTMSGSQ